jgi:hypothetical protein
MVNLDKEYNKDNNNKIFHTAPSLRQDCRKNMQCEVMDTNKTAE